MPRDDATLLDIAGAIRRIRAFSEGFGRESFERDERTRSAILYQLLVLGEAVKRLSDDFRERHPNIPLRRIAGMRDRVIHGYDTVDLDEAWNVVRTHISALAERIEPLLPREE